MNLDWLNIGLAFFEGLALIVSPCILPILPIILAGSLTGTKARPYGIITGFIIAFTIVTLFSRSIINALHISPDILRNISLIILILLGIIMMSTYLSNKFNQLTARLINFGSQFETVNDTQSGFLGGFFFGCFVSIIWTPCAGPILAAVIVQVVVQQTTINSLFVLAAFAIGVAIPMFLIAMLGRKIIEKTIVLHKHSSLLRKVLGLIIVISTLFLFFNPTFGTPAANENLPTTNNHLINGLFNPYPAPEIAGITAWINSKPLTINELHGKVILIDFWTYSCINCIRTLPYLKNWYAKYHDKGFEIIGVHSPEFAFEQILTNVQDAVKKFDIQYPVALDNQFVTWRNYNNRYWPAHFLIDKTGKVVYEHFGEGEYTTTENNIRFLLGLKNGKTDKEENVVSIHRQTPEIYLGYARAAQYAGVVSINQNQTANYSYPPHLPISTWALQGKWQVLSDKIVAMENNAAIKLHYYSKNVYAVLGNKDKKNAIEIKTKHGNKVMDVTAHQLYTLITQANAEEGELELIIKSPGIEIYTFTFGQ